MRRLEALTRPWLAILVLVACGPGRTIEEPDGGPAPTNDAGPTSRPDAQPALDAGSLCTTPGTVETVACGMCGTVDRFCTAAGTWAYGACEGESGECAPGSTRESACGSCGTQSQRCTVACAWEDTGECTGEGVCAPGSSTRSGEGCPAGQTREVACSDACAYAPASACMVDSCSSPGSLETVACGRCGTQQRFCTSDGVWEYGLCSGEGVCMPGATRTAACGRCGMRTEACDASCDWIPFGTCEGTGACCVPSTEQVDLLFLVDNSNSMAEEQASLTAEIPRLVRALATGDSDGDGTADFAPIGSLQAAVITTDMGVGGASVPTCPGRYGDDGVLITRGRTAIAGCMASYPPIFSFAPTDDPDGFSSELSCVATTGTGGCGFEQPLEAVLKALSPASATAWTAPTFVPPVFFDATSGHALGANAGFVRPDSLLVVVLVTDEEDCSALDPGVFDPLSSTYTGDLNLRCFNHPGALHPVARFVDGLAQLRLDPERLIVASIVGIPVGAEPATTVPDYGAILAHPDMVERLDPSMTNRLAPSCNVTGRGVAFPPRRILTMQQELEARGIATTTGSICQSSFASVTSRILARIADRLPGTCP